MDKGRQDIYDKKTRPQLVQELTKLKASPGTADERAYLSKLVAEFDEQDKADEAQYRTDAITIAKEANCISKQANDLSKAANTIAKHARIWAGFAVLCAVLVPVITYCLNR